MKHLRKMYWGLRLRVWQHKLERIAQDPYWKHKLIVLPPDIRG